MDEHKLFSADSDDEELDPTSAGDEPHSAQEEGENELNRVNWLPEPPLLYRAIKRAMDIAFSMFALVVFSPLFLAIILAVRLTSQGPVIFRQKRVGYRGKIFEFLKFRSMYVNPDPVLHREYVAKLIGGEYGAVGERPQYKVTNDSRITPVGRFLRRTSLDEFPQFWNILRGDMSLVGPRPPIPYELAAYKTWHKQRLSTKPGLTGLWQVKGRSRTSFDDMVKLDIEYIEHPSIFRDLKILFATPKAAIRGDKAF
jgi:lipopolysaccharide/colanic/teichoic acid biosynthesis glycosyltransferase